MPARISGLVIALGLTNWAKQNSSECLLKLWLGDRGYLFQHYEAARAVHQEE